MMENIDHFGIKKENKMKNKMLLVSVLLCLSLALMGCTETESDKEVESQSEIEESKAEAEETSEAMTQEVLVAEETSETMAEETSLEAEETTSKVASDASPLDLFKSLKDERPKTLRIVSEVEAYGMITTMTTYYDGDKSRTEIDIPNMAKSIMINLPEEEIMYQYVYGETSGVVIRGASTSEAEDMGFMADTSLLRALQEGASDDITARMDLLGDEEVIYIEATQADDDMGEMLVKMWYSEKYATPLKYEIYVGDTLMTELRVSDINDQVNFNEDTFLPPADVVFQEVTMDDMMNMW